MKYGLIGERLSHSFSKEIHGMLAPYSYELCELKRGEVSSFLQRREFSAVNVTIPYKKEVIPYLDEISDVARELECVNTVVNRHGRLFGYNTDYIGLKSMMERSGVVLKGKKVLILGTGATSRTARLAARELSASEILLVSRQARDGAVTYEEAAALHTDASVIINTTPVGTYPDSYSSPIDIDAFGALEVVFDTVYNPLRTALVIEAKKRGIYAEGGLYMLVSQAVHAVGLFLDAEQDGGATDEIHKKILKSKENIVLTGMPSSGKTTVARLLSEMLGREFFDLDDEIEKRLGCTIAEFFESHTERDFREVEAEITRDISKKNGTVIATGGGCILRQDNIDALRSNGRIYFLDRGLRYLTPTYSRPLARHPSAIENLYRIRRPLYLASCDVRMDGDLEAEKIANLIYEEFLK